ncbi:hypothetical protein KFK09_017375 [Dendrobium nobile]|uniref:Uncharacterized protein n=1 Tax=Dendrobium nobile TaxID=94219 RepID=A0A8T3B0U2_DENNO|nr:hypothetical protein KFK09_017375 [Dendrobium nobile]
MEIGGQIQKSYRRRLGVVARLARRRLEVGRESSSLNLTKMTKMNRWQIFLFIEFLYDKYIEFD